MRPLTRAHTSNRRDSHRLKRWVLAVAGATALLCAVAVGTVSFILANLDRPWLKRRIQAYVLSTARIELDYASALTSGLAGLEVNDLIVRSPAEVRAFAPELLHIGRATAQWSLRSILCARPSVGSVRLQHVSSRIVVDENGRTSFDAIAPSPKPTAEIPISGLPATVVGVLSLIQHGQLKDAAITVVRTERKRAVERYALRGLALETAALKNADETIQLALGRSDAPLSLELTRQDETGTNRATAQATLVVRLRPADATVVLDVRVLSQDFAPDMKIEQLVQLDASVRSDASAGRTDVHFTRLALSDGMAVAKASIEVPDNRPCFVRQASGDADIARLLKWVPQKLAIAKVRSGQLHYRIDNLAFDCPYDSTVVALDAMVTDADVALTNGAIAVGAARLSLQMRPEAEGHIAQGTLDVEGLSIASSDTQLQGDGILLKLDGHRLETGVFAGQAQLVVAELDLTGHTKTTVRNATLEAQISKLLVDLSSPHKIRGDIWVQGDLGSIQANTAIDVLATPLSFQARVRRTDENPFALDSSFAAGRLRIARKDGTALVNAPACVTLGLTDFVPDFDQFQKSDGTALASLELGALRASISATKKRGTADYDLTVGAARLGELLPLLPPGMLQPDALDQMAIEGHSTGRFEQLATPAPKLTQHTELHATRPQLGEFAAQTIALDCDSSGTAMQQSIHARLDAEALKFGNAVLGNDQLMLAMNLDRAQPSLQVQVSNEGATKAAVTLDARFDKDKRVVSYELTGGLVNFTAFTPLWAKIPALSGFNWTELGLRAASHGEVGGVVSDVDPRGGYRLTPEPLQSASGQCEVEISAANLRWSEYDRELSVPSATWRATLRRDGTRSAMQSDLRSDAFDVVAGRQSVKVSGFQDRTSVTLDGSILTGVVEYSQEESVREVKQSFVPQYPIGDLALAVNARRNSDGLITISGLRIDNRAAGTSMLVTGGIEADGEIHRIALRTQLKQDLARVWNGKDTFIGRGKAALDVLVESPNLRVYHTTALLELANAHIHLPGRRITLDTIDGELPVSLDVAIDSHGVVLLRKIQANPYNTLRFSDQHPLLSHSNYLSIRSVTLPFISIEPFVANLEIEQNLISLSQLEMGVRGGRITGNGVIEWNEAGSKVHADVRASAVESSYGEPFDGNAALDIDLSDRSVEGRADILRIGRRHLLDLIELQDPYQVDPGMNQIRNALALGYPERVNVEFKHGFASAGVEFGGLAQLLSVGEVRGIPMGPLVDRVVGAFKFKGKR